MNAGPGPPDRDGDPILPVAEIRDYRRINGELIRLLDAGHPRIILAGVDRQRLLASELAGSWRAIIIVRGHAGPELSAGLNAPGLTVVCLGDAADGAGSGLSAGRLDVQGDAGDATGYAQAGGAIRVRSAGHRAGLGMSGGDLIVLGEVGRLAGERQSGGRIVAHAGRIGLHASRGRTGGEFVRLGDGSADPAGYRALLDAFDRAEAIS